MDSSRVKTRWISLVEYAQSIRSICNSCCEQIPKDWIVIFVSEEDIFDVWQYHSYHYDCFWKDLNIRFDRISYSIMRGVNLLEVKHQKQLREDIAKFETRLKNYRRPSSYSKQQNEVRSNCSESPDEKHCSRCSQLLSTSTPVPSEKRNLKRNFVSLDDNPNHPAKRWKTEEEIKESLKQLENQKQKMQQLRKFFKMLTNLERKAVLEMNFLTSLPDPRLEIEVLIDVALFGVASCGDCPNGHFVFDFVHKIYGCSGYIADYTKCLSFAKNPERSKFRLPSELRKKYDVKSLPFNKLRNRCYSNEETILSDAFCFSALDVMHSVPEEIDNSMNNYIWSPINGTIADTNNQLKIKKGTIVDSKFHDPENFHVHEDKDGFYSITMALSDISCNKNSYHKAQLLKHDYEEEFYIFQSWGRIGTIIGDTSTTFHKCLETARLEFVRIFCDKTGNQWGQPFRKQPGFYNNIDMDYSEIKKLDNMEIIPSKNIALSQSVQELITYTFKMRCPMRKLSFDFSTMPLGRVSQNQLKLADDVLNNIIDKVDDPEIDEREFYNLSNEFYSIVPHNFGVRVPHLIDSLEKCEEICDFLKTLGDYKMPIHQIEMSEETPIGVNDDLIDSYYLSLPYTFEPLDSSCEDYARILQYMINTQGSTHDIECTLLDIIKVERKGENEMFKKNIGNRMLLWHGSRRTNLGGIIREGLKIAPQGVPVTGRMFGKGVYFADMFSKSILYCSAEKNEEAYMLLCDVALGTPLMLPEGQDIVLEDLNKLNVHSVQGVGKEVPSASINHRGGYSIPLGKSRKSENGILTKLLYNEYVVYDTNQIEIKYLVKIKVKSTARRT